MAKASAGVLLHRVHEGELQVLLVHPGGPFWTKKDEGAWSIPKGEISPGEDPLVAARRELLEETGVNADGPFTPLPHVKLKSGKTVQAFAAEGDCDAEKCRSNTVRVEFPSRSGRFIEFPEVDRAEWFSIEQAMAKMHEAQRPWLAHLPARA